MGTLVLKTFAGKTVTMTAAWIRFYPYGDPEGLQPNVDPAISARCKYTPQPAVTVEVFSLLKLRPSARFDLAHVTALDLKREFGRNKAEDCKPGAVKLRLSDKKTTDLRFIKEAAIRFAAEKPKRPSSVVLATRDHVRISKPQTEELEHLAL